MLVKAKALLKLGFQQGFLQIELSLD